MNITRVVYSPDRVITVCVNKTSSEEQKLLVPGLVRHAIVFFSIGLRDKPKSVIEEAYKINKNKVKIYRNVIVFSFSLDELNQIDNCQITIDSLMIYLDSQKRIRSEFSKTFSFIDIYSVNDDLGRFTPFFEKRQKPQDNKISGKEKQITNIEKQFINSYENFKDVIEQSNIGKLITYKAKSFDHALKEFGIALLCRVLLSISHLNILLENDFKEDLNIFLRTNVLNLQKEGCEV